MSTNVRDAPPHPLDEVADRDQGGTDRQALLDRPDRDGRRDGPPGRLPVRGPDEQSSSWGSDHPADDGADAVQDPDRHRDDRLRRSSACTSLWGRTRSSESLKEVVFTSFASWSLSVIPMFVLMGVAMGKSGLMSGAYDSARKWLSRLPGGLAIATNFAGAGMAATSGSTIGIAYAIGRVSIPEMIRSGYSRRLAMGVDRHGGHARPGHPAEHPAGDLRRRRRDPSRPPAPRRHRSRLGARRAVCDRHHHLGGRQPEVRTARAPAIPGGSDSPRSST